MYVNDQSYILYILTIKNRKLFIALKILNYDFVINNNMVLKMYLL